MEVGAIGTLLAAAVDVNMAERVGTGVVAFSLLALALRIFTKASRSQGRDIEALQHAVRRCAYREEILVAALRHHDITIPPEYWLDPPPR